MKILILSPFLPWPLESGGKTRIFNLVKRLVSYRVEIVLLFISNTKIVDEQIEELKTLIPSIKIISLVDRRSIWRKLCYYFLLLFKLDSFCYQSIKKQIKSVIDDENIDIIQYEFLQSAKKLPEKIKIKKFLVVHEIISLKLFREAMTTSSPFKKTILYLKSSLMQFGERASYKKFDFLITMSEVDKSYLQKYFQGPIEIVPNGASSPANEIKKHPRKINQIYIMGWFGNVQNIDSLDYFLKDIYPILKKEKVSLRLAIIGRDLPKKYQELVNINEAKYYEFIESAKLDEILSDSVLLAPLRFAGGTRLKILEAMARGNPVVSTNIGAEGLEVENNKNILLADNPVKFAECIIRLIKEPSLADNLANNAKLLVADEYDWQKITRKQLEIYYNALNYGDFKNN
ncbi:MAG: glycosyltransferase family 4 protein [Patescibacteria group bacterium]|jgi:glycosyltransferase involved in cell wall biosynthesis